MPPWFPFALVASVLFVMASGSKAGWKTQAELAEEERRRREAGPVVQGTWPFPRV